MTRGYIAIAFVFAAACLTGAIDRDSAEVSQLVAMDAPRPIFEPQAALLHLSMPCPYIQMKRFDHEPVSAGNTRCAKTDRSDK
jgi:hypothetical protein